MNFTFVTEKVGVVTGNPWFSVGMCLLALIAIVVAVILYFRQKRVKQPVYAIRSSNLVRDFKGLIDKLKITYARKNIQNLTITKIAFWNKGKDTMVRADIASAEPLNIRVRKGVEILEASVIASNNTANLFSVKGSRHKTSRQVDFEYADKNNGVVIQVIHTGKSSKDVKVCGVIKGAGEPKCKEGPHTSGTFSKISSPFSSFQTMPKKVKYTLAVVLFLAPIVTTLAIFTDPAGSEITSSASNLIFTLIACALYWGVGLFMVKRRVPKGLEVFESDF